MRVFGLIFFLIQAFSHAATAAPSPSSLKPEVLSAKALLEDLLMRRLSQELAAIIKKDSFNLATQLELLDLAKTATPGAEPEEPISGLMLGRLDPEELLKKYGAPETAVQNFLNNYKIKAVNVSVGLNDGLDESTRAEVDKWLKKRLSDEFGKVGKGTVTFTKMPMLKAPLVEPKTLVDWLSQFQTLAGQFILGFLALLAVLLWKIGGKPIAVNLNGPSNLPTLRANLGGDATNKGAGASGLSPAASAERAGLEEEVAHISRRLNDLAPKVLKDIDAIIRSWCQKGEAGRMRLACFAEAVSKEIGKLPIPVDAMSDISKSFERMPTIEPKEKKDILEKAYWDLLSVVNLGPESLDRPFAYLGGLNLGAMKDILMDQNPKMQTLVSIFMPDDLRKKYVGSLATDVKVELLKSAAQLNQINATELRTLDQSFKSKFQPSSNGESVQLDMTLKKVVDALSYVEQLRMLPLVPQSAMLAFKCQVPSLAFINEWPDEQIQLLVAGAEADHIVALLAVRSELTERILKMCPPLTAEVVRDDLSKAQSLSDKHKNEKLEFLARRLESMVQAKEISLEDLFQNAEAISINDAKIKVA